jgi:hypothetical protein
MADEAGRFGPVFARTTLDAQGTGAVQFQATDKKLEITNLSVICSTADEESIATVYKGQIGELYRLSGSYAGSTGDSNNDKIYLDQGESIYVVWTGGDAGAIATATISGWSSVPGRGFRAVH